ncbi:hypothetical protein OS965_34535 [Streptomyces sp. H27-G5]|uniref:hypothetical protein n=1 Tax=Streptomyces sp. H27-G5 TaxID=2996698 RepID=UPI00226F2872|nr:hypothetical protein [Streptomyces sp. H27-G5]MCY0923197.1 hypothetical protein [Streptomyces sp. H27-G5]
MSTERRPLGRGPATGMSTSSDSTAQRLLPVERAGGERLVDVVDGDQVVVEPRGRRVLGLGIATSPEGVVEK